ncbi:MAG: tetratricopeptide (TPR) repeat protein [Limisphaerales bacterium]|jgi:tetratricopeptide (TPR) repeat protein
MLPYKAGNFAKAEVEFAKLISRAPEETELRFFMAVCQQEQGNCIDAISNYEQVLKDSPDAHNAALNMGNCWYIEKEYEKALFAYQIVRDINPAYTRIFNPMAHMYYYLNDTLNACVMLDSAAVYFADRDIDSGLRNACLSEN